MIYDQTLILAEDFLIRYQKHIILYQYLVNYHYVNHHLFTIIAFYLSSFSEWIAQS